MNNNNTNEERRLRKSLMKFNEYSRHAYEQQPQKQQQKNVSFELGCFCVNARTQHTNLSNCVASLNWTISILCEAIFQFASNLDRYMYRL